MRSTIFAKATLLGLAALVLAGCGAHEVRVEGNFPTPVMEKLPITLGVYYDPEFRGHTFHEENVERGESDWIVRTGEAQVKMHNALLAGMFERVVYLNEFEGEQRLDVVRKENIDAILVPRVDELQYTIPRQTKINVFEIWLRYAYKLYDPEAEILADWTMTSYGKTPTAFLQTAEGAVNLAAIVAMRDAGANFAVNFAKVPEVKQWLASVSAPAETPGEETPGEETPGKETPGEETP